MEVSEVLKNWDTNKGLLTYSVGLFLLFLSTTLSCIAIGQSLISKREILMIGIAIFILCWLVYFVAWKSKRSIFVLKKQINIIFCYYNVTGTDSIAAYYKNFQSDFREKISELNLPGIKVTFWPMDKRLGSEIQAENLVKKGYTGHTIMVWGELREIGGTIECRKNHFSYEFRFKKYYPRLHTDVARKLFGMEVQKSLNNIEWNKNLANRKDFDSYSENMKDITLYIIGRTLLTAGEFEKSVSVLTKLLQSLLHLNPIERQSRGQLIGTLKHDLAIIHSLKAAEFYKKDFQKMEYHCKLALENEPTLYDTNIAMAYIQERIQNNEVEAKRYLRVAALNARTGQDAHRFSEAYMLLKNKKYNEAILAYERLGRIILRTSYYVPNVAEDLYEQYKKTKQLEYLFGEGFVKTVWMPKSGGKAILRKFIKLTDSNSGDYIVLRSKALEVIKDA